MNIYKTHTKKAWETGITKSETVILAEQRGSELSSEALYVTHSTICGQLRRAFIQPKGDCPTGVDKWVCLQLGTATRLGEHPTDSVPRR